MLFNEDRGISFKRVTLFADMIGFVRITYMGTEVRMKTIEITSVSSKGQVVIPRTFRKNLGIETGTKPMVFSDGTNLLLKPMEEPKLTVFKQLIAESRRYAKEAGLRRQDVPQIIRKVRNANRH